MSLLLTLLTLVATAAASPSWTVTVDPLTTALGYVHVQVERVVNPRLSVYAGPHARLFDGLLTDGHEPYRGLGAETGVRWFPRGEAPTGPWLMARTVVARLGTTDGTDQAGFGGYSSVLGGGTLIVADRLVLSGGLGAQYLYYDIDGYGTRGPFVAAHTNVGVAF